MTNETLSFETVDGDMIVMPGDVYAYETFPGNFGIPPINYITRQGYKQHGVTEIDYILQTREFDLEFWRAPACNRSDYWTNRAALVDFFRPNRGGPITLTLTREDSTQRALTVRANPGPIFDSRQTNDWNIRERLSFTAFDPIWFNPSQNSLSVSSGISTDLVFPITFPIQFGASGLLFTQSITYLGNWPSFPVLRVDGPYTSVSITNLTTDVSIYLTVPISAVQHRILDLTPGTQSLVDENGDDAFGDLGPTSNLVDFNLRPDPEITGGVQTIQAVMYGGSAGVSAFSLSYYDRYIGI